MDAGDCDEDFPDQEVCCARVGVNNTRAGSPKAASRCMTKSMNMTTIRLQNQYGFNTTCMMDRGIMFKRVGKLMDWMWGDSAIHMSAGLLATSASLIAINTV